jgi:hypothetical protein
MGIYKFGNNASPWRIGRRSNLGHIFREKNCVLWGGKYGIVFFFLLLPHKIRTFLQLLVLIFCHG